jgi:hypothetical protein
MMLRHVSERADLEGHLQGYAGRDAGYMSAAVEDLLKEVADAPPCGADLSSDLAFVQLDQLAQGKPERSSGDSVIPAEPPPWP